MNTKIFILVSIFLIISITGKLLAQTVNATTTYSQELVDIKDRATKKIQKESPTVKSPLDYCIPAADCSIHGGFDDFSFAGIVNIESGCSPDGYGDFTYMQGTAEIGEVYTASIRTRWFNQYVSIWIDLNDDEIFTPIERVLTDFNVEDTLQTYEVDISIPGYALPGVHRLRAASNWIYISSEDPCATFWDGEWEDYTINLTGNTILLDAGMTSIDMGLSLIPGDVIPEATVFNDGAETITFPVTITEPISGYTSTVEVVNLEKGQKRQISFGTWDVEPGIYTIEICTNLSGDEVPDNNCKSKTILFPDYPRQKVIAEYFTGLWCTACPKAAAGLELLQDDYPDSLAIISWHNYDVLDFPEGIARDDWYVVNTYPTVWFDGWKDFVGTGSYPTNYPYFLPIMQERLLYTSNFKLTMDIYELDNNEYNVETTVDVITDNISEDLAVFVVLTETDVNVSGYPPQNHVARNVWPNAMGLPVDLSEDTTFTWNTTIALEEDYVIENCEVIVFIENMDTKEIYQGNSKMLTELTYVGVPDQKTAEVKVYPNPTDNWINIKSSEIINKIEIFNNVGQLIDEYTTSSEIVSLSTYNLKSGLYMFRIYTSDSSFIESVVIQ